MFDSTRFRVGLEMDSSRARVELESKCAATLFLLQEMSSLLLFFTCLNMYFFFQFSSKVRSDKAMDEASEETEDEEDVESDYSDVDIFSNHSDSEYFTVPIFVQNAAYTKDISFPRLQSDSIRFDSRFSTRIPSIVTLRQRDIRDKETQRQRRDYCNSKTFQ